MASIVGTNKGIVNRDSVPIESRVAALENRLDSMWEQAKRFTMKKGATDSQFPNSGPPMSNDIYNPFKKGDIVRCGRGLPFTVYRANGNRLYRGIGDVAGTLAITCVKMPTRSDAAPAPFPMGANVPKLSGDMAISSDASAPLSGGRATRRAKRSGKKAKKTRSRR